MLPFFQKPKRKNTPLHDQAYWTLTAAELLSKRADARTAVPVFLTKPQEGRLLPWKRTDIHEGLLADGYAGLQTAFRKSDFSEHPESISFELADRLEKIQGLEKDARTMQRGPIWSKYESEFTSYTKRYSLRDARERWLASFINFMK